MRNAGTEGPMVFEPAVVHAQVGDTLRMVGLIQVGEAVNRSTVTEVMKSTQGRIYSHGGRVDGLLEQVR